MILIKVISSKTLLLKSLSLYQIFSRSYPGLSNLLYKGLIPLKSTPLFRAKHLINYRQHILQQNINNTYYISINGFIETTLDKIILPVKIKPPIHRYKQETIAFHLTKNLILKKYIPIFEKNEIHIPFINEINPIHGVSGSYTLPPIEANALKEGNDFITNKHALAFAKYFTVLYGGQKIKDVNDIVQRINYLFSKNNLNITKDSEYFEYYDTDLIPIFQHILSQDTWNLYFDRKTLSYNNNLEILTKNISLQKHVEIKVLERTHSFLNHIKIMDIDNLEDIQFLTKYGRDIAPIVKQPYPDGIGNNIVGVGIESKLLYPVDIKLKKNPEVTLDMLSSYSSLSASIKPKLIADKFKGQISVQKDKLIDQNNKIFFQTHLDHINILINNYKKQKITLDELNTGLNKWSIHFAETQINMGVLLFEGQSFTPSIIADAANVLDDILLSYYNENPLLIKNLMLEFKNNIKFIKYYPNMTEYKTIDLYDMTLPILIILKKFGLLENYYAMREILIIKGVDD